ncbi:Uncharacterised protein [Mycobacteroides abscessus subsp. massiliense]|nr:Uncharacterised protein [Mycobacteroides abscessus subsp. massiliense]
MIADLIQRLSRTAATTGATAGITRWHRSWTRGSLSRVRNVLDTAACIHGGLTEHAGHLITSVFLVLGDLLLKLAIGQAHCLAHPVGLS